MPLIEESPSSVAHQLNSLSKFSLFGSRNRLSLAITVKPCMNTTVFTALNETDNRIPCCVNVSRERFRGKRGCGRECRRKDGERERERRVGGEEEEKKNRQHFNCFLKKVQMKNSVCLEGHGEILAGRIARPYEKGRPQALQGDEYWFFIKHFASISKGGEREREKETTGKTRALESA